MRSLAWGAAIAAAAVMATVGHPARGGMLAIGGGPAEARAADAHPPRVPPRAARRLAPHREPLPAVRLDADGDGIADVAVGAPDAAKTFVFLGGAHGLALSPVVSLMGSERSGASVANAGDVNDDGYGDLIVGSGASTATLFLGGAAGFGATAPIDTAQALRVGTTVASAGDVDGDGLPDWLVGTRYGALLFLSVEAGLDHALDHVLAGPGSGGESVAGGVDFNGDGFADVAVGSGNVGVNIYLGRGTSLAAGASVTIPGTGGVAAAGDVNGDGYSDLLVAVPGGAVAVHAGGPRGLSSSALVTLRDPGGTPLGDALGLSMSSAGDVNGDGFDDIILGAPAAGKVLLFLGGRRGPAASPEATLTGPAGSHFGAAVAGVGDVDDDGFDDVVVGAPGAAEAVVFLGSKAGLATTPAQTLSGPPSFGTSIARFIR
jgi:FG-GAP-like repeat